MPSKSKYSFDQLLEAKANDLSATLKMDLPHPTSQGDLSENGWISFLRSFLPSRYAVGKGYVFDSQGNMSQQIDVIVYDAFHSPLIYETPNGEKYVTAESVYAVFEIKPSLTKQYLCYASTKIQSVRKLYRTSRPMISSGKVVPARKLTPILGGFLATRSRVRIATAEKNLNEFIDIDIACVADTATFRRTADGIQKSSSDEAIFAFFYLLLDELFKLGTVPAIDIRQYANRSLKTIKLSKGEV